MAYSRTYEPSRHARRSDDRLDGRTTRSRDERLDGRAVRDRDDRAERRSTHEREARGESRGTRRVTALDGLRVIAMLAIVVYHANASWLPGGFIGVSAFFTLSGYLIADSLLREIKRTGTIDVIGFYKRRILRLMPLMTAVVAITAILCALRAPQLLQKMRGDALPALLYFENWWYIFREQSYFAASGLPSPITHFWFLSVLGQFYLIIPWIVLILARVFPHKTGARRVIAVLMLASLVASIVLFDPQGDPSRVYYGTDTRLAEILVGVWLAYAWPTDGMTGIGRAVNDALPFSWALDILAIAAFVALGFFSVRLNGYSPILYRGGLFGVSVLTALIIAAVTLPQSLLAKVLGIKPFSVMAARSFGIYLWHYPLLLIMNPATRTTALTWQGWALEALAIVVAAELTYQLVEKPLARKRPTAPEDPRTARYVTNYNDDRSYGLQRLKLVGLGLGGLVCAAAAVLLIVGPVWYHDGATDQARTTAQSSSQEGSSQQQQQQDSQQAAQPSQPSSEGAPAEVDNAATFTHVGENLNVEGHKAADAVVQTALSLERRIHGYEIDPETGKTNAPVILIGDSVPAGAIDQFYEIFPYGYIDAEVGRQIYVADDVYLDAVANGNDKEIVVFASGDNGVADDDDMQHLLSAAAGHKIYLVTVRVPLPLQDMNNALFYQYAEQYDNVEVIDWYAESEGHDEYFWDDGTHLRPEGAEAYVLMLRRAIIGE